MKIAIIGGGIIGLASALRIGESFPGAKVTVLEKENGVGRHQTGHNSGVLHCGLYYKPGSMKARMAVTGIRQMVEFCRQSGIRHEICGKIVVATTPQQVPLLNNLFERGQANGLEGLRMLGPSEIREIEPHAAGLAAIHVPQEGIVDYAAVCAEMVRRIREAGNEVRTQSGVEGLKHTSGGWLIRLRETTVEADFVVNCAGLQCDRVGALTGDKRTLRIIPFRGEYYAIRPERSSLVRNLIYPVPDPNFPFLGVHFTRLIGGGIEAGPNAVLALKREGYRKTDFSFRDFVDTLTYSGFWRFLLKYPGPCVSELQRSFSKELFCRSLQVLVPEIRIEDLGHGGSGVRAQAIDPAGQLVQDFCFSGRDRMLNVLNAPSPGATASLAIGEEISKQVAAAV
jgi:L-2-hydroxyglutarate oxidase LhgO